MSMVAETAHVKKKVEEKTKTKDFFSFLGRNGSCKNENKTK